MRQVGKTGPRPAWDGKEGRRDQPTFSNQDLLDGETAPAEQRRKLMKAAYAVGHCTIGIWAYAALPCSPERSGGLHVQGTCD